MNNPIKVRLHVISPIHIGCDDVYEPTGFVIDEQKKKLIEFDLIEFVKNLTPDKRNEFTKITSSDNLLGIFKAIKRFYEPKIKGREVEIVDYLVEHYKNILRMGTFDKKAVINQFTIQRTAYNPYTNQPYIPGSSLKGSLRTAYLNVVAKKRGITNFNDRSDKLESFLLKRQEGKQKFSTDPFRMVKVSDFLPVENVKTRILYAINRKKQKSDKATFAERGGVYQIFEVIQPNAVFEGIINVNIPEKESGIKNPINIETLLSSTHKFYEGNLEQEIQPLNDALGIKHKADMSANSKFQSKFKESAFLVRIGRHSSAEAVTIEGNRKIKIIQGRGKDPKYSDHATTIWLASETPKPQNNNNLLPFGWAVLELV